MSLFKCKMCGAGLEIDEGSTVVKCEYCGTKQTLPRLTDSRIENLYDRANHFRRTNDYDKALNIYEQILSEDNGDSEAHWSIVLCKYGIEYVEDPTTHNRIPTVNRAQYTSIFADEDYKSAIRYATPEQRGVYESEAKAIDDIQKGILELSKREAPFDVFICYKETDVNGRRTVDSVLATDLYNELTREGYRVFFSRITLEDKIGQEYEPYIFAALNSASVMVLIGTKTEYFNSVWVKNEWSRYLSLIKNGAKKTLIPAYKDIDPYDLPDELSHLQAQDMSRLGFMQDLVHAIKKQITSSGEAVKNSIPQSKENNANVESTIDYVFILIEDGNTQKAINILNSLMRTSPKHPMIYVARLLIELGLKRQEELASFSGDLEGSANFQRAVRFADFELRATLESYARSAKSSKMNLIYVKAVEKMNSAQSIEDFISAKEMLDGILDYSNSRELSDLCIVKAKELNNEGVYQNAIATMSAKRPDRISNLEKAIMFFNSIIDYKDSREKIDECERLIKEKKAAIKKRKKRTKIIIFFILGILLLVGVALAVAFSMGWLHIHKYTVLESSKATCISAGYEVKKCDICDKNVRVEYKATGHKFVSATCTLPEKCKNCGITNGAALGHISDGVKCTRCKEITFKPLTYSGKGSTVKNLSLPKGEYRITCTMTSESGNMTIYLNFGANSNSIFDEDMIFNNYVAGSSEVTVVEGPIENGSLVVNASNYLGEKCGWKIVIEAIS